MGIVVPVLLAASLGGCVVWYLTSEYYRRRASRQDERYSEERRLWDRERQTLLEQSRRDALERRALIRGLGAGDAQSSPIRRGSKSV